jgi:AraC-like DNA-binding protein
MRSLAPSPALRPYLRDFMVVEVRDEVTRLRLPEPGLVVGVRYRGAASLIDGARNTPLPDVTVTGLSTSARRMRTRAGGAVVLARFRPGGAARFFPEPVHQIFGASVALDQLLPPADVARLHGQVIEASGDGERVAMIERFLLSRLRPRPSDPVVEAAVQAIVQTRGLVRIRALARQLGISQDPLEKRFRRAVGASPKQLASLLRLRHAIDAYRPGTPLTRLAQDAGYFDQSHFNRALRAVTGEPPGRFFRAHRR